MRWKGRNGGMAIAIRNHILLFRVFVITLALMLIPTVIFILQKDPYFWLMLLLPAFFFLLSLLVLLGMRYDERSFLQGAKKDHVFELKDGILYKDSKEIRLIHSVKLYQYPGFLYMETSHSMFVIRNDAFVSGSREALIAWAKSVGIPVRIGY